MLTPGPMNETYFEHAYLARYLGLLLVEGEDLTVRDDGVFVRTVAGLRRADVFLRRLDSDFADPLELNAHSRIGTPGLTRAVSRRQGRVRECVGRGVRGKPCAAGLHAVAGAASFGRRPKACQCRDLVVRTDPATRRSDRAA
ncbi:MAG: circularly permuted type 2 ATP-grasp protein [Terricaulis sp.]